MSGLILPAGTIPYFGRTNGNLPIQQPFDSVYGDTIDDESGSPLEDEAGSGINEEQPDPALIWPAQAPQMCEGLAYPPIIAGIPGGGTYYRNNILAPTSLKVTVGGSIPGSPFNWNSYNYSGPYIVGCFGTIISSSWVHKQGWVASNNQADFLSKQPLEYYGLTRPYGSSSGVLFAPLEYWGPYDNGNHTPGGGWPDYTSDHVTDPDGHSHQVSYGIMDVKVTSNYPDEDTCLVQCSLSVYVAAATGHPACVLWAAWDKVLPTKLATVGALQAMTLPFKFQNISFAGSSAWINSIWGDWSGTYVTLSGDL